MAQKKILSSIELPNLVSDLDTNPNSGFTRFLVIGNDLHLVTSDGDHILYQKLDNWSDSGETDPVFTYVADVLTRIDYASGNYKLFTYTLDNLTQLDFVKTEGTFRKTFTYDSEGNLLNIIYTQL